MGLNWMVSAWTKEFIDPNLFPIDCVRNRIYMALILQFVITLFSSDFPCTKFLIWNLVVADHCFVVKIFPQFIEWPN